MILLAGGVGGAAGDDEAEVLVHGQRVVEVDPGQNLRAFALVGVRLLAEGEVVAVARGVEPVAEFGAAALERALADQIH